MSEDSRCHSMFGVGCWMFLWVHGEGRVKGVAVSNLVGVIVKKRQGHHTNPADLARSADRSPDSGASFDTHG